MPSDHSPADHREPSPFRLQGLHRRTLSTAVLALATVGAGVLVLAGGDATGQASTLSAPPTTDRFAHPRPSATPAPSVTPKRPPARDPFRPLYTVPAAPAATDSSTAPPSDTSGTGVPSGSGGTTVVFPVGPGPVDAGPVDVGPVDPGPVDVGPVDPGPVDPGPVDPGPVDAGPVGGGSGSGQVPVVPRAAPPVERRTLVLTGAEITEDAAVALFTVGGVPVRVPVSGSFGPADQLLLLSVQQGPRAGQWTAVVKPIAGSPFDVVTGTTASVPAG